jgi:ribosomal protein L19
MSTASIPFEALRPGDQIRVTQRIKVGLKVWTTNVAGTVEKIERRRNGLHVKRNFDDAAFQDLILLRKPDGEQTTVTLDEFTLIERA